MAETKRPGSYRRYCRRELATIRQCFAFARQLGVVPALAYELRCTFVCAYMAGEATTSAMPAEIAANGARTIIVDSPNRFARDLSRNSLDEPRSGPNGRRFLNWPEVDMRWVDGSRHSRPSE
jgi:hypothetical protein